MAKVTNQLSTEDILKLLSTDFPLVIRKVDQIHRCVYILTTTTGKIALKIRLRRNGFQRFIGKQAFREELRINENLRIPTFNHFSCPKLVHTDRRKFFVYEYIDWNDQIRCPPECHAELISALFEFQSKLYVAQSPNLRDRIRATVSSPLVSILRCSVMECFRLGVRQSMRCAFLVMSGFLFQKMKSFPLYQHRDLGHPGNLKMSVAGVIYFLDFESTRFLARWPLLDAVDLSFAIDRLIFDRRILKMYLSRLAQTYEIGSLNIEKQIRFLLIRKSLNLLRYERRRAAYKDFLENTLLDNHAYAKWFAENVGESEEPK